MCQRPLFIFVPPPVFSFWLDFLLREIDARTDDDDDDAVVVVLRAHNAHQGPRREIITLSKKKRILRALSRVVSFLFFNYSRERGNWWNR